MKKILAMILMAVMLFSVPASAAWENDAFSKDFETVEEMCAYIEQYAKDYPHVEYGEIDIPIQSYEQKNKDFLLVSIDDPDYVLTELSCYEPAYREWFGLHYTNYTFEKNDGEVTARIDLYYGENADEVRRDMEFIETLGFDHITMCTDDKYYFGEVSGYPYYAFYCHTYDSITYGIAADDVYIECNCNTGFDEEFVNNFVIEKSGIELPVLEHNPNMPIKVTDEVLEAVRKEYNDDSITKEDISVSIYSEYTDGRKLVRITVEGYDYTEDEVVKYIGDYEFYVPQRPEPQMLFDGILYDFDEAYNAGVLSDSDLEALSWHSRKYFEVTEYSKTLGNVDDDKTLTVTDATYIQRYICGYNDAEFKIWRADFDQDGKITIFDATNILRFRAGY